MQLPEKQKTFSEFIAVFLKLPQILNILKRSMTFIAHAFSKLRTAKEVVR